MLQYWCMFEKLRLSNVMLLSCVLFNAVIIQLFEDCLFLKVTFVELFALDIFCFFVDNRLRISLIDILLVE